MGKFSSILQKLQQARLERETNNPPATNYDKGFNDGFSRGVEKAEQLIFEEQERNKNNGQTIWYSGSPNDLKTNNSGDYILIMKAHFDSEDGIEKDKVYITQDYWNGEDWEGYELGEDKWEVLYFCKLKWLHFPIPVELGLRKTNSMFIK